jgi:hypothetical protein
VNQKHFALNFQDQEMHDGLNWIVHRLKNQLLNGDITFSVWMQPINEKNFRLLGKFDQSKGRYRFILSPHQELLPKLKFNLMKFYGRLTCLRKNNSPPMSALNNSDRVIVNVLVHPFLLPDGIVVKPYFSKTVDVTVLDTCLRFEVRIRADASLDQLAALCFLDFDRHGRVEKVSCLIVIFHFLY